MPKVSIVIPVYNVAPYIRQCLESVLNQTLHDIEIICVDDGSTDQCPEILDEYARKDNRVKVIHKANSGYGHSMNVGMDASTGEYFAILESDDVVVPEMYEELSIIGDFYKVDIVKADFYRFVESKQGNKELVPYKIAGAGMYNKVHYLERDRDEAMKYSKIYTWSGIYRRSFLYEHNIRHNETPGASYQDNGFWFQTMSLAKTIYFFSKNFYCLRRDNPNSSIYNKQKVYCICEEYDFILKFLQQNPAIYEQVIPYYWKHLFGAYKFTLNRIANEYKEEFIHKFAKTLEMAIENKELDKRTFCEGEWNEVQSILEGRYYREIKKKQEREAEPPTAFNRMKWCYEDNGLRYTVKHTIVRIIEKILPNYSFRRKNKRSSDSNNIMTRSECYLLLDEIHGIERDLIIGFQQQNARK